MLDAKGKISSLPKELAAQFDLKVGEVLHPSLEPKNAPDLSLSGILIERADRVFCLALSVAEGREIMLADQRFRGASQSLS